MKCLCPACGRSFPLVPEQIGFLARCSRRNTLLKTRLRENGDDEAGGDLLPVVACIVASGRRREVHADPPGTIAQLLCRAPGAPGAPVAPGTQGVPVAAVITVNVPAAAIARPAVQPPSVDLTARPIAERQMAIRRAELRGQHHILGVFSFAGSALIAILTLFAVFLKTHPLFAPRPAKADTVERRTPGEPARQAMAGPLKH